jgi:hypothetical protein
MSPRVISMKSYSSIYSLFSGSIEMYIIINYIEDSGKLNEIQKKNRVALYFVLLKFIS